MRVRFGGERVQHLRPDDEGHAMAHQLHPDGAGGGGPSGHGRVRPFRAAPVHRDREEVLRPALHLRVGGLPDVPRFVHPNPPLRVLLFNRPAGDLEAHSDSLSAEHLAVVQQEQDCRVHLLHLRPVSLRVRPHVPRPKGGLDEARLQRRRTVPGREHHGTSPELHHLLGHGRAHGTQVGGGSFGGFQRTRFKPQTGSYGGV